MSIEEALERLCSSVPWAVGAVVCDDEGETVISRLGRAKPPEEAESQARDHVPKSMALSMPVGDFLVRLAGAELCAVLRRVEHVTRTKGTGSANLLHLRYRNVDVAIATLPEDYYVVAILRRPCTVGWVLHRLRETAGIVASAILE